METSLRAEIKQKAPFRSLEQEVFLNVLRTAALLEHALAERFKPHGLTLTQYNALRILRGAGREGLCRNDVRSRMLTPVPDATRLLDRLAERGLVVRGRDAGDRRFVTTRITPAGLELLAKLDGLIDEFHERELGHMSDPDLRRLARLLEQARAKPLEKARASA